MAASQALVAAVVADLDSAPVTAAERELLRFVAKVNGDSPRIGPQDMQPLYALGWSDAAIYAAITVTALFNFYNRWIDATGVHALSDADHAAGAQRSAAAGYARK